MKKTSKTESQIGFIYLIASELLFAGICTALFGADQGLTTITIIAGLIAATCGIVLIVQKQLVGKPFFQEQIIRGLKSRITQFIPSLIILSIAAFLFISDLNNNVVRVLSPILFCIWLIGIEFLLLFPQENRDGEIKEPNPSQKKLIVLSLVFALGIIITPSRIPSLLNGIPLETPFEFILITLLLPFAFMLGARFFANKTISILLGFLLAIKIIALILLPQAGLGVRSYSSEEALFGGKWEKSYSTFFTPSYTEVTQFPYHRFRELPIEWVNRVGFIPDEFWVALQINGVVHLQENERLAFIVNGAQQVQIQMMDAKTGQTVSAVVVDNSKKLNAGLYQEIPAMRDFQLQGTLVFKTFGQYRIEPLIVHPDGATRSAFESPRIWISDASVNPEPFQFLIDSVGIALAGLLIIGLVIGISDLYRTTKINALDLYLAATASVAFYIANLVPKPGMSIALMVVIIILATTKFLEHSFFPRENSWEAFLVSIGPAFLLMFLSLDVQNLRDVFVFPQKQDSLEYQILAHNIFVNRDFFLLKTPPWVYKVLFPYLVGFLHLLFGQSASAQFFLNAWCALLSGILILYLSRTFNLPARTSTIASISFLLILFLPSNYIYYFRFGLIEPAAILCLLATYYFAAKRQVISMFMVGILTALLRMNFLGAIFAAGILTSNAITGAMGNAWKQVLDWVMTRWKLIITYILSVVTPSLLIGFSYSLFIPNYTLSPSLNKQTSPASVLESMLIVVAGGDLADLRDKFQNNPLDISLIAIPVALGFLIALVSLVYRKGLFKKIDLRLSLLILGTLPIYLAVRPIGYFPRYSWSPLPLCLIIIALFVHGLFSKNEENS